MANMKMTNEQKKLLATIVENRESLEALLKMVSMNSKQVKDLQIKERISFAGIIWRKFAEDENGNALVLADKCVDKMEFGRDNNWRESPIREKLNGNLRKKIEAELGEDALVPITADLFSHDGLRDYGMCEDYVSLLTYDLYRNNRGNIMGCNQCFWTCTPNSTPSGFGSGGVGCVGSDGYVGCGWCDDVWGVRPFCVLKSSIFVSFEDSGL